MSDRARTGVRGRPAALAAACLLAIACSSGGGSNGTGTAGTGSGTGGQGQAGSPGNAGSSGGTANAGTGGTQATAGTGGGPGSGGAVAGNAGGGTGGGAAGTGGGAAGTTGQAGSGGGAAGRGGTTGAAGRGGAGGSAGTTGVAGAAGGRGGSATGGGGATGTGGTGGGVANPVTPTMSGSRYRFAWGETILEVDASVGARVATLSLGGTDLIVPSTGAAHVDGGAGLDPTTWGSVFWTSPRSAWTPQTWPPPANIDNAAYTGMISGAHATFTGMADTSIGVAMAKDYSVDATTGWISITYTIKASKSLKAAPWEISRVPRGGITFFPAPMASSVVNQVPLTISQTGSSPTIVWFDDASMSASSPNGDKLYADGAQGWTAYVRGGNLFLKRFTDIPASAQPTGEGEVDLYPGNGFLEFEVEGPYTQLAANGNLPWSIQWKVVKVPSSVTVAVGSTSLVDFVRQQIAIP